MKRHGYISLWLLLVAAFGLMAWGSRYEKINIFGHDFKTASIFEELTLPPQLDTAVRSQSLIDLLVRWIPDTVLTEEECPSLVPKFPAEVDTTAKTILFFGDSMLEGLSPRLADYCKRNGHKLYTVIWYSSTTEIWGRCDTLSTFIRRYKPDYVFACLGANELFVRDIKNKRKPYLEHILDQIGDRPLLWIGPPNWKEDTGINDLLSERLEEGTFFLSNGMKFSRKRDGAHPTSASAAQWMDSIVRWMPGHCLHPILMEMPEAKGRPDKLILLQPVK
ncbi:MAG: hypothetical protein HDS75_02570 [Bacteroidales bacterium]|nr:hypothetical protein [Bacteroidales bacterium]